MDWRFSYLFSLRLFFFKAPTPLGFSSHLVQNEPLVPVEPALFERLSWGAVIAGAMIALIVQLTLNLLAISVGAMSVNPAYGQDSADATTLGTGAIAWVAISTLISLFIGGWLAARFAGIPDTVDGMLHGVLTWGIVTLVSIVLVSTAIGRIISGVTTLVGHSLSLAGQAAQATAQGAGTVVGGTIQAVGELAQGVASTTASAAQSAAQTTASLSQEAIDSNPEVSQKIEKQNLTFEAIVDEARKMLRQAGLPPEEVKGAAQQSAQDVKDAARVVAKNPQHAEDILRATFERVLNRGRETVEQVDRQSVIEVMVARSDMTEAEAQQTLSIWEKRYHQAGQEVEQARQQVKREFARTKQDVEQKADELQVQARHKAEELRHEAEQKAHEAEIKAREAAQATTDAIAKIAGVVVVALVVGAVAAGIGGLIGAPEEVPTAELDTNSNASYHLPYSNEKF